VVRYNSIVSSRDIRKEKNTQNLYFKNNLFVASVFQSLRLFVTSLGRAASVKALEISNHKSHSNKMLLTFKEKDCYY